MAKENVSKALVLSLAKLPEGVAQSLNAPTPKEFIKSKPGRGGKEILYVEVGYVVAKLNQNFGPLNWDFKVLERGETNRKLDKAAVGEVWVYGELTIKDHQKGFMVTKGAYGQHPIHPSVPFGDCLKAAESDALKKAASLFGVCLDVFWQQELIDESKKATAVKAENKTPDLFLKAKAAISEVTDPVVLRQYLQRVETHETFTVAQKVQLKKLINGKLEKNK